MSILVCPLSRLAEQVAAHQPGYVISLLDPGWPFPELGPRYADRHLRLGFHDIQNPQEHYVMPCADHISELLGFVKGWDRSEPLLIHCRAGISRSPAAAYIAACANDPGADERELAATLRRVAPLARPNQTLIGLADNALGRGGRMRDAIAIEWQELGWIEVEENEPFRLV